MKFQDISGNDWNKTANQGTRMHNEQAHYGHVNPSEKNCISSPNKKRHCQHCLQFSVLMKESCCKFSKFCSSITWFLNHKGGALIGNHKWEAPIHLSGLQSTAALVHWLIKLGPTIWREKYLFILYIFSSHNHYFK